MTTAAEGSGLRLTRIAPLAGLVITARSGEAQITTIDFESLACAGGLGQAHGTPLVFSGFTFASSFSSPTAFGNWCSSSPNFAGSTSLFLNGLGQTITLSKVGGGSFSLLSIMLARAFAKGMGSTIGFTGTLPNSTQVFQSFLIPGTAGAPTLSPFQFSNAFRNVVRVSWQQGGGFPLPQPHQFDNVVVNPSVAPEPTALTLMASGLFGLAGARLLRRRRRA